MHHGREPPGRGHRPSEPPYHRSGEHHHRPGEPPYHRPGEQPLKHREGEVYRPRDYPRPGDHHQRPGDPLRGREHDQRRNKDHDRRSHSGDHRQGDEHLDPDRVHDRRSSQERHNRPPLPGSERHRNGPPLPNDRRPLPPPPIPVVSKPPPPKYSCYKLIIDPMIHGVPEKVVRYDGVVPDDESSIVPTPSDPRKKPISLWKQTKAEPLELPIPRFLIDVNYVGEPPKVEVTFDNLNDNIDKQFLGKQIQKFGEVELLAIEFHPVTNKHLGLGRAVFKLVSSAKKCVNSLHGKTIMGRKVNCVLDPRGKLFEKMVADLTRVKEPTPPPPDPPPDQEPTQEEEEGWVDENGSWDQHQDWSRDAGGWPAEVRGAADGVYGRPQWDDEEARHGWEDNGVNEPRRERYQHDKYGGSQSRHTLDSNSSWTERSGRSRDRGRDRNKDFPRGRRQDREWRPKLYDDVVEQDAESGDRWKEPIVNPAFISDLPKQPPLIPVLPPPSSATAVIEEGQVNDERSIDLDTRLQMLMKAKTTNMPAFLMGSGTESSDTEQQPPPQPSVPPQPAGPLSRTPSPFLTRDEYMASHTLTVHHEELDKVNKALANLPVSGNKENEGMSPISEHGEFFHPPFPGVPGSHHFPGQSHIPGGPGYWQGGHFPGAAQQAWDPGQYNHQLWMDDQYNYDNSDTFDQDMHEDHQNGGKPAKKSGKDLLKSIMDSVVKIVHSELKDILKKDINKKLCESYAFLLFDKWWSDQEAKHKLEMEAEFRKKAESTAATTALIPDREKVEALPRIPKPEDLGNFIEKQRESGTSTFGVGGSLGLGFRGAIPKFSRNVEKKSNNQVPDQHKDKDKSDKKKKKDKHKEKDEDDGKVESKKKESKPSASTVYNAIYSDTDSDEEKKKSEEEEEEEASESSDVDSSDNEEASSSDKSSSSSSDSDSDDSSSDSSDSDKASVKSKSRSRSLTRAKSRSRSLSPAKARSKSKSVSPVRKSRSKSTSPVPDRTEPVVSEDSVKKVLELEKEDVDVEGVQEVQEVLSSSSSPALSRPPTPVLTTPAKPQVITVDRDSDTETGSEVEVIEEISTPRKDSAVAAAQALMALSGPKPSPIKIRNVESSPPHIMDHCYARPAPSRPRNDTVSSTDGGVGGSFDHDYTKPRTPPRAAEVPAVVKTAIAPVERLPAKKKTALPAQPVKFKVRDVAEKFKLLYKFLTDGIDLEDIMYLKRSYEMMLNEGLNQPNLAWINDTHWVDHPHTLVPDPPRKKRRLDDFSKPHHTGSARTEGYYKMDPREKMRTKYHFHRPGVDAFNTAKIGHGSSQKPQKAISLSREARSQQRRMLTALGDEFGESDLLKFNQLKFRRKAMKFGKSAIHDWGLFAMEHIGVDEMVIEYVGDVVRPLISDVREKRYEKQGIGSSYLFRIDQDYVVDATKCGNLARFINHSCDPNCYAKVIKIDGESKIVIYSRQPIAIGEEITYDYKFPIEDEKIRCLCGEKSCRKYLN